MSLYYLKKCVSSVYTAFLSSQNINSLRVKDTFRSFLLPHQLIIAYLDFFHVIGTQHIFVLLNVYSMKLS